MSKQKLKPGEVRDAIVKYLESRKGQSVPTTQIQKAVETRLGKPVAPSSVRSYLQLNTDTVFERTGRGTYRLK